MYMPRSVVPTAVAEPGRTTELVDKPRATILAMSSESGWAETDMNQDPAAYDAATDVRGPVPVAVAVERGSTGGMNVDLKPTRIVVIGDSDFAANGRLSGGNRDLVMNAVNWLVERESLIGVGPKAYRNLYLKMDGRRTIWLFAVLGGAIPAAIALIGAAVWMSRSR